MLTGDGRRADPGGPGATSAGPTPELRVVAMFLAITLPDRRALPEGGTVPALAPAARAGDVDLCFANPLRASRELEDALTALTEERRRLPGTRAPFLAAARSTIPATTNRRHRAAMGDIRVPVLLIHGSRPAAVRPFLPGGGRRAPQLGDLLPTRRRAHAAAGVPELVLDAVTGWLARQPTLRGSRGLTP